MSQNQGSGTGPGVADSDEPGTHAAVGRAAGYDPHPPDSAGREVAGRFDDPGLPAHVHRSTDVDEKAAKRAERQVAAWFTLSVLGTLLFVVAYFAVPLEDISDLPLSRLLLGLGLGVALFSIGAGTVHWVRKLMPDDEIVEMRHPIASSPEDRAGAQALLRESAEATGFPRRRLVWGSLTGALGALLLPAIVPLRDLWVRGDQPSPVDQISTTTWTTGTRLVTDPGGSPIRAADVPIGTVVHVLPEGVEELAHPLEEKAKAAVLLMRLEPEELQEEPDRADWSYNGIVAYSKICTHLGCPVALYEQQTHHLLCPCHQSTFDVTRHCKVIFGPAARPLPQLPIAVDDEGYLVAQRPFTEPTGPSFWERG